MTNPVSLPFSYFLCSLTLSKFDGYRGIKEPDRVADRSPHTIVKRLIMNEAIKSLPHIT